MSGTSSLSGALLSFLKLSKVPQPTVKTTTLFGFGFKIVERSCFGRLSGWRDCSYLPLATTAVAFKLGLLCSPPRLTGETPESTEKSCCWNVDACRGGIHSRQTKFIWT